MGDSTQEFGLIDACTKHVKDCRYKCCTFSDNYIVLYPGELEGSKLRKDHLQIIDDDYFGGKRAVCLRPCTEYDFKPLDCRSYPYFPRVDEAGKIESLRGKKCPLSKEELFEHRKCFLKVWKDVVREQLILEWLRKIELVGYELEE